MTTHRIGSGWLEHSDDETFIRKSKGRGLGGIIFPSGTIPERIEKMLSAPIACRKGCSMLVKDAPSDSMRCAKHGEPLGLVDKLRDWTDEERAAYLAEEAEAEEQSRRMNTMKRRGEVLSGGRLDGELLRTDPNRGRSPNVR